MTTAYFQDDRVSVSKTFLHLYGMTKAQIIDHVFFTFTAHYERPPLRAPHPDRPEEGEKTWVFFTLRNFLKHIPVVKSRLIEALKELERDGVIEVLRQKGRETYYRPRLDVVGASSIYASKAVQCEREPDRPTDTTPPLHPHMAKVEAEAKISAQKESTKTSPESGHVRVHKQDTQKMTCPETGHALVQKVDTLESTNRTPVPNNRELSKELNIGNSSARAEGSEQTPDCKEKEGQESKQTAEANKNEIWGEVAELVRAVATGGLSKAAIQRECGRLQVPFVDVVTAAIEYNRTHKVSESFQGIAKVPTPANLPCKTVSEGNGLK